MENGSSHGSEQSYHELEAVATKAAKAAITDLFEIFGADLSTAQGRKSVQDDWNWVRETRIKTKTLRKTTIGAVVLALASGLTMAIWKGFALLVAASTR